jgi:hypothetical protein
VAVALGCRRSRPRARARAPASALWACSGKTEAVVRARFYSERGRPVEVIIWWAGRGPRNVLIRRADGQLVVRPFRGLRRLGGSSVQGRASKWIAPKS